MQTMQQHDRHRAQRAREARAERDLAKLQTWLADLPDLTEQEMRVVRAIATRAGKPCPLGSGQWVSGLGFLADAETLGRIADIEAFESLASKDLIRIVRKSYAAGERFVVTASGYVFARSMDERLNDAVEEANR